jgi:hypothetical protein
MQVDRNTILSGLTLAVELGLTERSKIADLLFHTINLALKDSGGNSAAASQAATSGFIVAKESGLPPSPQILMPTEDDIIDAQRSRIDLAKSSVGSDEPTAFGDVVIGKDVASQEPISGVYWDLVELKQHVEANSPLSIKIVPRGHVRELLLNRVTRSWSPTGTQGSGFVSLCYAAGAGEVEHCPKEVFNITQKKSEVDLAAAIRQLTVASTVFYGEKSVTRVSLAASAPGEKMEYVGRPMPGDGPGES